MRTTTEVIIDQLDQTSCEATQEAWRHRYAVLVAEHEILTPRPDAKISVVVVGWRSGLGLIECLDQARIQHGFSVDDIELIVVDNGGNHPHMKHLLDRADQYIEMIDNVGPSPARNAGTAWASADVIAFLDDDAWIEPSYFERALKHLEVPNVAGLRARILPKHHKFLTTLASHYDRGDHTVDDCLITEGAVVIRRQVFMDAGGFADKLYGHDGIELTHRIHKLGQHWRTVYAPDVVMRHDYVDGLSGFVRKNLRYQGLQEHVAQRDESLGQFMDAYFSRAFDHRPRTISETVARTGLLAGRYALKQCAHLFAR